MVTRTHEFLPDHDLATEYARVSAEERAQIILTTRSTDEGVRDRAQARVDQLREEREALAARIETAARVITVQRLRPKAWGRLVAQHPPRPGDPYDLQLGVNTDTFDAALMPAAITQVTDGTGEPVDWTWDALADAMSPGQFESILADTIQLHTQRDAVPFSLTASAATPPSERS